LVSIPFVWVEKEEEEEEEEGWRLQMGGWMDKW